MKFFEQYVSNSIAGSANQFCFKMEPDEIRTGRVFYRISAGGKYNYSLLFSNIIDSTYAKGDKCTCNRICDSWTIHRARIGRCASIPKDKKLSELTVGDEGDGADVTVSSLRDITFGGCSSREVMPGEFLSSDPIVAEYESGEYLCLELTFSGSELPYHEESLLPIYVKEGNGWRYSKKMPLASMIGCDRSVCGRVAYLGDSITQGIGTAANSYLHWNALLSERLGDRYAFWNLGIGYGRASDAASDGAWLFKAKQNDTVFVCYGVNDINQGRTEDQIKQDLERIVDRLVSVGARVILQTVPPFNYSEANTKKWESVNQFIKTELRDKVELVFDNNSYLGDSDRPSIARFGGHPNEAGSAIWAEALFKAVEPLFR